MLKALTAEQSRLVEARAVETLGVSLYDLMVRAGGLVADLVEERFPSGRIAVLAGPGNNGGDGWVAAHRLAERGREVHVFSLKSPDSLTRPAAQAAAAAVAAGVVWSAPNAPSAEHLAAAAVIVDALLGTGASLPLRDPLPNWLRAVRESGVPVLAVDLPTGVESDTGGRADDAVEAEVTITFSAPKRGLVIYPGAACAGELVLGDIGVPESAFGGLDAPEVWLPEDYRSLLPMPRPDAHKNERGRVLVVAGSGRFVGAAVLAARGAMRAGAGYVTVAVPEAVVPVVQAHLAAAPVVGLPSSRTKTLSSHAVAAVLALAADYDAVVLGPGLTLADGAVAAARGIVSRLAKPLVVDADALNALVDAHEILDARKAPTVLTPHPGELSRLLGASAAEVQRDRVSSSSKLTGPRRAVVLKGAGTVVSDPDRQVIVTSGTPALATAGTGDVLAGVVGALLAQGLGPLEAGALGAYLHGRAGEAAAADLTPLCVTAEDVPDRLADAVGGLLGSW